MKRKALFALIVTAFMLVNIASGSVAFAAKNSVNSLYVYDLKSFISQIQDSKVAYDYLKLATALQGLANRKTPQIYYFFESNNTAKAAGMDMDKFWYDELNKTNGYLSQFKPVTVKNYFELLDTFKGIKGVIKGIVLWDENVPATANVASTAAGVENLLPVRYDETPGSLYDELFNVRKIFSAEDVKINLVGKFTGQGTIPDTGLASTGSAKNDAYLWAKVKYLDTGLTNPTLMADALDAASWKVGGADLDNTMVSAYIPKKMKVGQEVRVAVTVENTGKNTWTQGTMDRLGSQDDNQFTWTDLNGGFSNDVKNQRVFMSDGVQVAPGQKYTFYFNIAAPAATGSYTFSARMVRDGVAWLGDKLTRTIEVVNEDVPPQEVNVPISGELNAVIYSVYTPTIMKAGQKADVSLTVYNAGTATWTRETMDRLGTATGNEFAWENLNGGYTNSTSSRVFLNEGEQVAPGQKHTFHFTIVAPSSSGNHTFSAQMIRDGKAWMGNTFTKEIQVTDADVLPGMNITEGYNSLLYSVKIPSRIKAGTEADVSLTFYNAGKNSWSYGSNVRLASTGANGLKWNGLNGGYSNSVTDQRVFLNSDETIASGHSKTFTFKLVAPATSGSYTFSTQMICDGVTWFGPNFSRTVEVTTEDIQPEIPQEEVLYTAGASLEQIVYIVEEPIQCSKFIYPDLYNSSLPNADYYIARRAFFFDLSPDKDSTPNDDKNQKLGTDYNTLIELLRSQNSKAGEEIITIGGFVPWWLKYTKFVDSSATLDPVGSEWKFVDIISQYNAQMDADAYGLIGITNASVYKSVPLNDSFAQKNDKGENGKVYDKTKKYVMFYMGDFDAGAWTSGALPVLWNDPKRGEIPLAWSFASGLSKRVPQVFNYIYDTMKPNDYFVAGDNGAGYLNPMMLLKENRPDGLPEFLNVWEEYNTKYYKKFDIDITGFLISGNSGMVPQKVQEVYSRLSPAGVGTNSGYEDVFVNNTPFITVPSVGGEEKDPAAVGEKLAKMLKRGQQFLSLRYVLTTPSVLVDAVQYIKDNYPEINFEVVDPYTFFRFYTEAGGQPAGSASVVYDANNTTQNISIDGKADAGEWDDSQEIVVSPQSQVVKDFGMVWGNETDETDLKSVYKIKWDSQNLYLLEQRQDDSLNFTETGDKMYLSDATLFFLDLDYNKSGTFYRDGDYSIFLTPSGPDGKPHMHLREGHNSGTQELTYTAGTIASTLGTNSYTMEVAIPWSSLQVMPFTPADNMRVGMSLLPTDNDGTGNWGQIMWVGDGDSQDNWADMRFVDISTH